MSKVIVTGAAGFIGTHTCDFLRTKDIPVYGYDIKTPKSGHDICNFDLLCEIIEPGDKILHLAAVSRFADAEKDPVEAWRTNVYGTAMVVQAADKMKADRVVYSSTGSVYMPLDVENVPVDEKALMDGFFSDGFGGGNSVYGHTKAAAELPIRQGKTPWIILRYAHIYGIGKEWGATGAFVERMQRGLKPTLFGGAQSNDFTSVHDIVQANYLSLFSDKKALNQVYNIGTGEELTTEHVFETMKKVFKYKKGFERSDKRNVDASRFVYDISKAQELLGYNPRYNLEDGLIEMKRRMDNE